MEYFSPSISRERCVCVCGAVVFLWKCERSLILPFVRWSNSCSSQQPLEEVQCLMWSAKWCKSSIKTLDELSACSVCSSDSVNQTTCIRALRAESMWHLIIDRNINVFDEGTHVGTVNTRSLQTNHTSFVCLKIPDKTFFFYQGSKPNLCSYEDGWVCCIAGGFVAEWWHQIIKSEDRIIIFLKLRLLPDYCCTDQSCKNKPTKYLICRRRIDLQSYCMVLYRHLVSSLQLKHFHEWPTEDKLDGSSF